MSEDLSGDEFFCLKSDDLNRTNIKNNESNFFLCLNLKLFRIYSIIYWLVSLKA